MAEVPEGKRRSNIAAISRNGKKEDYAVYIQYAETPRNV